MPIFEYKCRKCGKQSELLVLSKTEEIKCEHCGSKELEKLLSTFAAHSGGPGAALRDACPSAHACRTPSCCSGGGCPSGMM